MNRINIALCSALALLVVVAVAQHFHARHTADASLQAQEELFSEERARWEAELAQMRDQLALSSSSDPSGHLQDDPEALIEMLYTLDIESERKKLRKAIYCFRP
jgi:hypothetical protein